MHRTPQNVLSCPMDKNNAGATTVREYLVELMSALWYEEEGFSSKRPFGDSDWQFDVYLALNRAGLIDGLVLDSDGYVEHFSRADQKIADDLIQRAIWSMRSA